MANSEKEQGAGQPTTIQSDGDVNGPGEEVVEQGKTAQPDVGITKRRIPGLKTWLLLAISGTVLSVGLLMQDKVKGWTETGVTFAKSHGGAKVVEKKQAIEAKVAEVVEDKIGPSGERKEAVEIARAEANDGLKQTHAPTGPAYWGTPVVESESLVEQETGVNRKLLEAKIASKLKQMGEETQYAVVEALRKAPNAEDTEESAKTAAQAQKAKPGVVKKTDAAKTVVSSKDGNSTPSKPNSKQNTPEKEDESLGCELVEGTRAKSLVKKASLIRNNATPAYWRARNESSLAVAVLIRQDGKDVAIAYIGPNEVFKSRIPATHLSLSIKTGLANCVDVKSEGSVDAGLPLETEGSSKVKKEKKSFYTNAIFETVIENAGNGVSGKTRLVGYSKES